MRLDVSKALVAEGQDIPFSVALTLAPTSLMQETVTFPGFAELTGHYVSVGDTIRVHGRMRFTARSACMRCLTDAERTMETPFDVLYSLAPDPENPDIYAYDGAWIDPLAMAQDMALLALPMQWLCGEDCRGLCPACGTDLNKTQCSCRMEAQIKHPFSALQQLLTKDESEV